MELSVRFSGCILAGAIEDAWGSAYENVSPKDLSTTFYPFGKPLIKTPSWQLTDDTQLTLATCESISPQNTVSPDKVAATFLKYYKAKQLSGLGASTLKELQELNVGGHWSQVGRRGTYVAGNGAAMRIAPLAFCPNLSQQQLYDICTITHQNEEAYVGALSIILAIQSVFNKSWTGKEDLLEIIINQIPDTLVRDQLIKIQSIKHQSLEEIGRLGNSAYVVHSVPVPLAIAAAYKAPEIGITNMFETLIRDFQE